MDNPLVKPVDPIFVGAHLHSKSQFSSKSIAKRDGEKVGVFAKKNGSLTIVEYSELPKVLVDSKDAAGNFVYGEGNTAIHLIDLPFIEKTAQDATLPYSRAFKKEAYWQNGQKITPPAPNAIKFEQFIFAALPLAQNPIVLQVAREDAFSPVKNAEGVDSPKTSRDDQLKLWAGWLKAVGVAVPLGPDGVPSIAFEVTPVFADTLEDLRAQAAAGKLPREITAGLVL